MLITQFVQRHKTQMLRSGIVIALIALMIPLSLSPSYQVKADVCYDTGGNVISCELDFAGGGGSSGSDQPQTQTDNSTAPQAVPNYSGPPLRIIQITQYGSQPTSNAAGPLGVGHGAMTAADLKACARSTGGGKAVAVGIQRQNALQPDRALLSDTLR